MMTLTEKGIALTVLAFLDVVTIVLGLSMGLVGILLAVLFLALSVTAGTKIIAM